MRPHLLHFGATHAQPTRQFLLVWLAVPMFFRLLALLGLAPNLPGLTARLWAFACAFAAGLPQDLLVAAEMWLVAVLLYGLLTVLRAPGRIHVAASLLTLMFAAVQLYGLVDALLYAKIGMRLNLDLLAFGGDLGTLASSAQELGLGWLLAGLAALAAGTVVVFRCFVGVIPRLRCSTPMLALLPLALLLSLAARRWEPAPLAYAADDRVASDQLSALEQALGWQQGGAQADPALAERLLAPRAEIYTRVNPDFPLLKDTRGFVGEESFEVAIEPGERPHVVFLFLESFRARDVGALGGTQGVTPNFDRLAKEGLLFTQFYGNGVQTTRGVVASLFGLLPRFSAKSVQAASSDLPLIGMADLFNRRDYRSGYFYGGGLAFENQEAFFRNHGYAEVHGEQDLQRRLGAAARTSWGYHDEYLLDYVADWLTEREAQGQPGFATVFTITNHHPWRVPQGYVPPETNTPADGEYHRFLQTMHYTDHCLGRFVERLRQKGLDRKTVFFILADTGTPMGEHHQNFMLINYLYEEGLRIPLLIWAPGRISQPARIDALGSQVDLLPTVMDLFGMTGLNHAVGTSLARQVNGRQVFFNNPFALQYQGLRRQAWKYIHCLANDGAELFNVERDPGEQANLAAAHAELVASMRAATGAVNDWMTRLYLTGRIAPAEGP